MQQLALELLQYPRPIAWTISEVNRAEGHRDQRDMLLAAYEEVIRYLVLIETARYAEYWASGRGEAEVDRALAGLRRPSLGHYVAALRELDEFLSDAGDRYAIGTGTRHSAPMMCKLCEDGPGTSKRVKQVSLLQVMSRVTELRNEEKGHGYTGQLHAEATTTVLQPALQELLERIPLLLAQPLVWVEHIELVDEHNLIVTLLALMGTQRAQRIRREVREAGSLKKGFLYMWDGEAAPLTMTPFLHLERSLHDEEVYVLAGVDGEPVYRSRGSTGAARHPDHLMSQLEERAPFLLKPVESKTVSAVPNASRFYQSAVEVALADAGVSQAEAAQLERIRKDL
ncbi:MAG TPA: hypothetical protein VK509_24315, partial [Polyangiales bacterium]|nr:hypothetical protein [Polyangiales bacterium]